MAYTVCGASAQLGYGISEPSLQWLVDEYDIDAIAADAGSNDPGPYYYGSGEFFASVDTLTRDLRLILRERDRLDVPLVIANAATGGTKPHLDKVSEIVHRIADEEGLDFQLSKIYTDVDKAFLNKHIANGNTRKINGVGDDLSQQKVADASTIVSCIGYESYLDALETGSEVIIGGRSLDIAPYTALAIREGYPEETAIHFAKLLECAGSASEPKPNSEPIIGSAGLIGILHDDYFELAPASPHERCSLTAAANQTLHEKADPYTLFSPHGTVDISNASYQEHGDRLRISGGEFNPNDVYSVLLEGVEKIGYRTIAPVYIADPNVASNLKQIVEETYTNVVELSAHPPESYDLVARKMGENPNHEASLFTTSESDLLQDMGMGMIIEVLGETESISTDICSLFKSKFKSINFKDRVSIGGNMMIPYSQSEISMGAAYTFSIYHLLEGVDYTDLSEIRTEHITERGEAPLEV